MADSTVKGAENFLVRKVGPLPMWAWMGIGGGLYWWFSRKQSASSTANAANQQTDPAGNIGTIDPATGYVYGTPEDLAALAANNAGTSSPSGSGGQGATGGGQTYADNNAWGIAAVNYLVGLGIDATTANQAIQLYLSSQPLTTAQQGDVNLAIGALGPPPSLPGPVTGNPPPVTHPPGTSTVTVPNVKGKTVREADAAITAAGLVPGAHSGDTGTVNGQTPGAGAKVAKGSKVDLSVAAAAKSGGGGKTAPVPTGLVVASKTSTSATIKWRASRGATGYQVTVIDAASKRTVQSDGTKSTTDRIGNLNPSHTYQAMVAAEPNAGRSAAHASVTFTTSPSSGGSGGPPNVGPGRPGGPGSHPPAPPPPPPPGEDVSGH